MTWGKLTGYPHHVLRFPDIMSAGCGAFAWPGTGGLQNGHRMGKAVTPPARSPIPGSNIRHRSALRLRTRSVGNNE